MVRRAVPGTPAAALRGGFFVLLASISLPAVAASGFNMKCDDAEAKPADLTASSAVPSEPAGDHESLTVLKTEGDDRRLAPLTILDSGFDSDVTISALEQQELRSSALADALERRRRGRLDSTTDDLEAATPTPQIDTALPGVGDAESMLYRREMYRTDI